MPDLESVLAAAEQAAGAGDLEAAERLLREGLSLQEARLGAVHPDVANTVNNLAVVCERLEKLDAAEAGYRRAHAIAVAALPPRHPFVATSLKNLVDFCAARGIPLWTPPAAAPRTAPAADALTPTPVRPQEVPAQRRAAAGAALRRVTPRMAAAAVLIAASLVVLLASAPWPEAGTAPGDAPRPTATLANAPVIKVAPPAAASPAPPARPIASPAPVTKPSPAAAPVPVTRSAAAVTVLAAQVCREFARRGSPDWECAEAGPRAEPGVFTFYTRVSSPTATTIEHRWYRDDRLHQTMKLAVRPGGSRGYRTFSRTTVGAARAGTWRVELRSADGGLLEEARFEVR